MGKRLFDLATANRMAQRHADGATLRQLAVEFGCGETAVRSTLHWVEHSTDRPRSARLFDRATANRIAERHADGATLRQLAAEFGGSTEAVYTALRSVGRSTARRDVHILSESQGHQVGERYQAGESVRDLAAVYGVDTKCIRAALRNRGIPSRPFGKPIRFSDEEASAIGRDYQAGASIASLARQHSCDRLTVERAVERVGVSLRTSLVRWTPEFTARVVADFRAGQTTREIGARLGVSAAFVSAQLRRAGVVTRGRSRRGPDHWNWKAGRMLTRRGYVLVAAAADDLAYCTPNSHGYVLEHRLVMGQRLGRRLARGESVHHINGDKADNRLENLQLRQGHHGSGQVLECRSCGSHDVAAVPL